MLMAALMLAIGVSCGALLLGSGYGPGIEPTAQPVLSDSGEHQHLAAVDRQGAVPPATGNPEASDALPPTAKGVPPLIGASKDAPGKASAGQNNQKARGTASEEALPRKGSPSNKKQVSLGAAAGMPLESANRHVTKDPTLNNPVSKALGSHTPKNRQVDDGGMPATDLPERKPVKPSKVLDSLWAGSPGGCLEAYGENGQCLPTVPPSQAAHVRDMIAANQDPASMQHSWTCRELRTFFKEGIKVRVAGTDPQQLDRNGDAVACGQGD